MKPEGMPKQELEKPAQAKVLDERVMLRRRKRRRGYVIPPCQPDWPFGEIVCLL